MDKKTLVNIDIEEGKKLLEQLDRSNMKISCALWYYVQDIEEWRLILATDLVDTFGPKKAYTNLLAQINKDAISIDIPFEAISLISPNDPLIKLFKFAIITGPGISGIRFSGNVINGVLIKDSYLYRVN